MHVVNLMRKPIYRVWLLTAMICSFCLFATAQTPGYVQNELIKVPAVTTEGAVIALADSLKITTRNYLDGLGRTTQTISVQASPLNKDIVQPVVYDAIGRTATSYLPFIATTTDGSYQVSPLAAQAYFYSHAVKVANDDSLYSRQLFETSPLQRLLKAGSVGSGFEPVSGQHYKAVNYRTNITADSIVDWTTAGLNNGIYAAGNLQVTDVTDEDAAETLSFKNNNGQVVLKRQLSGPGSYIDTYYIYNEAGAIMYMVPPKAIALMRASGNWSLSQTAITNLIFSYFYDNQARLIQKTVPGGVTVYVVYDPLNRPVLLQDANLRAKNQWNYIKYDEKGHQISQGIYTDNTDTTLSAMQTYVNGLSYSTTYFESRSTNSGTGYYTNNVFPTSNTDALAYSYYDNYDLDDNGTNDYSYQSQGLSGEATATSFLRGVLTMVRTKAIGQGLSNTWLIKVMFYDKNGRSIQVQGNNQLNSSVNDIQTNVSDFTGVIQIAKVTQVAAGTTTTVLTTFSYDHVYRIKAIDQSYNGGSVTRIAGYEYNELGQLVKRNLDQLNSSVVPYTVTLDSTNSVASGHTVNTIAANTITLSSGFTATAGAVFSAKIATNYLQAIDYRYNIRGQMLTINNSKLTDDGGATNNDGNDLFGMQMLYDQVDSNLGNTASYSGRISGLKWMTLDGTYTKTNERSYTYSYDALNRLTASNYAERTAAGTAGFSLNTHGFDESGITYDENGNILTLQRTSSAINASTHVKADSLNYTYQSTNPNQLKSVTDGAGSNFTGLGFRNLTGSTGDYTHDNNGNLTADPYKGLTLTYNTINRADQITVTTATNRYIRYTYNAGGQLIRKQQYDHAALQKTTDYIDGFVYEDSTLAYFPMPEGRVVNVGGTLKAEFVITDQQGNARLSFRDNGSGQANIMQESSYYAFGLVMANSPVATPAMPNKNLYNGGSEWQNDYNNLPDLMQTFYRNYDAALGRWTGLDPNPESAESMTNYQYGNNNPITFNDPDGDATKLLTMEAPTEEPAVGSRGFGGGVSSALDFMHSILANQVSLLYQAKSGDPQTIAQYIAQNGTVLYQAGSDPLQNNVQRSAIINLINSSGFSTSANGYSYTTPDATSSSGLILNYIKAKNNDASQGGTQIFGATLTTEAALSTGNSDSFVGKYLLELKYTQYTGIVNDKGKGILNFNTTIRNGEKDHDVSLDIGKFSFSMGLTSRSISYDGYSFNFNASIIDGITYGISHTTENGNITGSEFTINPFKIIPVAAAAAYYTAPYWVPVVLAPVGL